MFGETCGFDVRKKRPRFSDGKLALCTNDVINAVYFPTNTPISGAFQDDTTSDRMNVYSVSIVVVLIVAVCSTNHFERAESISIRFKLPCRSQYTRLARQKSSTVLVLTVDTPQDFDPRKAQVEPCEIHLLQNLC